jgi:hypothetical protein
VSDHPGHAGDTAPARTLAPTLARHRQTVGLVLIAAAILLAALLRAPAHVLFPPGWWRF